MRGSLCVVYMCTRACECVQKSRRDRESDVMQLLRLCAS